MAQRKGGIIQVQVNGEIFQAKGNFTYNLGRSKREAIVGSDAVHGYKEVPQVGFIEGEFTDGNSMSLDALVTFTDATVTLALANGKVIVVHGAYYAGEGSGSSEEGAIPVRFEGEAEEVV